MAASRELNRSSTFLCESYYEKLDLHPDASHEEILQVYHQSNVASRVTKLEQQIEQLRVALAHLEQSIECYKPIAFELGVDEASISKLNTSLRSSAYTEALRKDISGLEKKIEVLSTDRQMYETLLDEEKRAEYDLVRKKEVFAHTQSWLRKVYSPFISKEPSAPAFFETQAVITPPEFLYILMSGDSKQGISLQIHPHNVKVIRMADQDKALKYLADQGSFILKYCFCSGTITGLPTFGTAVCATEADARSMKLGPFIVKVNWKDPAELQSNPLTAADILEIGTCLGGDFIKIQQNVPVVGF